MQWSLYFVNEMKEEGLSVSEQVLVWPVLVPAHIPGGLAATIERERTKKGDYPPEWPAVAWLVKTIAGWKCERCGHPHSGTMADGWGLTVHHLDKVKWNLQHWNLAALCQRCHLKIEHRVNFFQVWAFEHSPWMARHVADYNEYALPRGLPLLPLVGVAERDYTNEWST